MMNEINRAIFVDSTISHNDLSRYVRDTDLLLPAIRRGDLIQVLTNTPSIKTVVIVDGVFEQQASITHKEILWALKKQVVVVGLSSMGALRAFELRNYGMIGYGNIFHRYISGCIDGDDEVAISYIPTMGDLNKTIALVNIRSTLEKINYYDEDLIFKIKKINFKDRSWLSIEKTIPHEIYMELKFNYVDQKKEDVVSYFKEKNDTINSTFDHGCIFNNIYLIKEIIKYKHIFIIDFIEENLKYITVVSKQKAESSLYVLARDIATYLELDECNIQKMIFILNELHNFNYCKGKIKNVADIIRREQNLYSSSNLLIFLNNKNLQINNLFDIFEGISKLKDYFMDKQLIG